jgi:hypothetical protein
MNINAPFVNIDFLYYSGSVKEMNIYTVKNAENRNQSNNFLLSHLPVVVKVVQPQALLLQVVLRERGQVVKPSKTGCFTRIFSIRSKFYNGYVISNFLIHWLHCANEICVAEIRGFYLNGTGLLCRGSTEKCTANVLVCEKPNRAD